MTSWMRHEIIRVEAIFIYLEVDKGNEILIRTKSTNPTKVIFRHKILTSDKDLIPILMTKYKESLDKVDEVIPRMKSRAMEACFEIWEELTTNLKNKVPHSPFSLNRALFKAITCKEVIKELKLEWIG